MAAERSNPTAYLQDQFGSTYDETNASYKAIAREANGRRALAYSLKGVAALGGLVLTTGLLPPYSQVLGFAIAAVVVIDGLLSNHLRLITAVKAKQAYRRLLRMVVRTHQRELAPILSAKQAGDANAESKLNALNARLLSELHSGSEQIETALDDADVKALMRLSLDQDSAGNRAPST
jgi:hypothetical protein